MTVAAHSRRRLARLHDVRISPGEPDVHNWLVIGTDGRRIGRVRDLFIEMTSLRTCFVDVSLDPGIAASAGGATAVLPVECLRTDPVRPYIHVLGMASHDFVDLPGFGTAPIGAIEERELRRFFRCDRRSSGPEEFWLPRRRGRAAFPYVAPARGD